MVINFSQVRALKQENEDNSDDAIMLLTGYTTSIKPNIEIDCYKISHADMALIRDAFKTIASS